MKILSKYFFSLFLFGLIISFPANSKDINNDLALSSNATSKKPDKQVDQKTHKKKQKPIINRDPNLDIY